MDCELVFRLMVLFGLLLNSVGTLLIAFSIVFSGEDTTGLIFATGEKGRGKGDEVVEKKATIPALKKPKFWWGVGVFVAGFVSQFAGVFFELIVV